MKECAKFNMLKKQNQTHANPQEKGVTKINIRANCRSWPFPFSV